MDIHVSGSAHEVRELFSKDSAVSPHAGATPDHYRAVIDAWLAMNNTEAQVLVWK